MKTGLRTLVEVGSAFVFLGGLLAGCGETKPSDGVDVEDGSLRGVLNAYMSDDLVGQSDMRYTLRAPSGLERTLLFDHDMPDLVPGSTLKVRGIEGPEGVRVISYQVTSPPIEERTSALKAGPAYSDRAFAFVLVDVGGGVNITADAALGRMVNDAASIRNYYLYDSYGRQNISAQVFGPLSYTMNGCDTGPMATALRPMVTGTFQHYLWYIGSRQTACAWAGLASVGTAQSPSRDTWYNASSGCVVLVQEPGHNFGMQHSSSIRCTGTPLSDDTMTCTASEYGDVFDPMGGGCRHMNAWQKAYQGWFGGCNGVNVTANGTFTLLPYEMRCDGVQYLQIPAPKSRTIARSGGGGGASTETLTTYFLELRTPLDFDGTLGGGGQSAITTPRVLLHIANDVRSRNQRAIHPYLIDMTPATTSFNDAAMVVGTPFVDPDPAGPTITVMAVSATEATVQVSFAGGGTGAPTCLDDTPFTAPGPSAAESCIANTPVTTGVDPLPGSGGAPGSGGRAGMAGTGGRGTGGAGGTRSGGAGTGGAASGGNGTVGPMGGSTGNGTGGAPGGPGPTPGNSGGADTGPGPGGPGVTPGDVTGGCGCQIDGNSPAGLGGMLLVFGLVLRLTVRRRQRRGG